MKIINFYERLMNRKVKYIEAFWFINPFSTNVPLMDKPGSWFLLAKCLKNT